MSDWISYKSSGSDSSDDDIESTTTSSNDIQTTEALESNIKELYKKALTLQQSSSIGQNGWIEAKNIKPIKYKNKNIFKDIQIFKGTKYKWGGKTFNGIDCSALVQVCLNFNNEHCPRDTDKQVNFFKKNINLKNIKKNDIIYWNGHVAVAISKKN